MSQNSEINEELISKFDELKLFVEALQTDVVKHAAGNKTAGVRVRKGLREAKKLAGALVKISLEEVENS